MVDKAHPRVKGTLVSLNFLIPNKRAITKKNTNLEEERMRRTNKKCRIAYTHLHIHSCNNNLSFHETTNEIRKQIIRISRTIYRVQN